MFWCVSTLYLPCNITVFFLFNLRRRNYLGPVNCGMLRYQATISFKSINLYSQPLFSTLHLKELPWNFLPGLLFWTNFVWSASFFLRIFTVSTFTNMWLTSNKNFSIPIIFFVLRLRHGKLLSGGWVPGDHEYQEDIHDHIQMRSTTADPKITIPRLQR